jgi:hypothetical protein
VASIPIFFGDKEASLKAAMVFPRDEKRAKVFAAWLIIERLKVTLDDCDRHDLSVIAFSANDFPYIYRQAQKNIQAAARAGFVVALLWRLLRDDPRTASWDYAIETASNYSKKHRMRATTRALFRDCLAAFQPTLHLLGAATMRQSKRQKRNLENPVILISDPSSGYERGHDLLFFAAEARELQRDLRQWNARRPGSSEYFSDEMFNLDDMWNPPPRLPAWPDTGRLKGSPRVDAWTIDPKMKVVRKSAGRPKSLSN